MSNKSNNPPVFSTSRPLKRITVLNHDQGYMEWPPEAASEFLAWIQAKLELIPTPFRASARIEFGSISGPDAESFPCLEIYYMRPEVAEESADTEAGIVLDGELKLLKRSI
jgi:hypothetical protein